MGEKFKPEFQGLPAKRRSRQDQQRKHLDMVLKIMFTNKIHTVSKPLGCVAGQTENQINGCLNPLFFKGFYTVDKSFQIRGPVHGIKGLGIGALQPDLKLAESDSGKDAYFLFGI